MAKLSRRNFIKIIGSAATAGVVRVLAPGLLAGGLSACQSQAGTAVQPTAGATLAASATATETAAAASTATASATTPAVLATPTLATAQRLQIGSRVLHLHATGATQWGGQSDYWSYVNPDVVEQMVARGLTELTGQATVADAWRVLIPAYQPGQGIAIKVNFNNTLSGDCNVVGGEINALPQPVAAIVAGLKAMGVDERDVWVYDGVNRFIPAYFTLAMPYGDVQYFDKCHQPVDYYANPDPNALVDFNTPQGVPTLHTQRLADVLTRATYLINMPILKNHDCAGISLGFKNHLGSIDDPGGLHSHIMMVPGCSGCRIYPDYSPLVDLYRHPHIGGKTVLTVGDGLFGARGGQDSTPTRWSTFENQVPNSLFFATDPVAIDSVMADYLRFEPGAGVVEGADAYLEYAQKAGLGTFERGDPWGGGYRSIEYRKIEL